MNLQQLEYFIKIAETENFTLAAASAKVTQPALSKAISKLEEELKVPLFERNSRSIKLTAFGTVFLKHASLAIMEIENGINELQAMLNPDDAIISIASTHCIGTYFMPFIISDFLNCTPDAKFQFNHESTPEIINDLKCGKITLGFYDNDNVHDIFSHAEITSVPVKKEEYVLIASKNHPLAKEGQVSLKDLKDQAFIVFGEENKNIVLSCSKLLSYTPKISVQPTEITMLGGLVAAGAGIAIVAKTPLLNTNNLSVLKIKENIGHKTIYMGYLKDSYMSPIAEKFKEHLVSSIEN